MTVNRWLPCFVIYTKENCEWCDKAKELLNKQDYFVIEFSVENAHNKEALKNKGLKTVPQIWFQRYNQAEPEYIGGYDKLEAWLTGEKT